MGLWGTGGKPVVGSSPSYVAGALACVPPIVGLSSGSIGGPDGSSVGHIGVGWGADGPGPATVQAVTTNPIVPSARTCDSEACAVPALCAEQRVCTCRDATTPRTNAWWQRHATRPQRQRSR